MDFHPVRAVSALAAGLALVLATAAARAADPRPTGRPRQRRGRDLLGHPVHNPYRALEAKDAPPVQAWMQAQLWAPPHADASLPARHANRAGRGPGASGHSRRSHADPRRGCRKRRRPPANP